MADYVFLPAMTQASVSDYLALFESAYVGENKLTAEYLRWQYVNNPHGKVIGVDAFMGDRLAAHYAIIPRRYKIGKQSFKAALSVNTATHPMHQGKGLFTKLAEATYELAAELEVKFIIGAANANSVGGFTRKLGFTNLGQIRLYASFKGALPREDALDVAIDPDWLSWRLLNPSRTPQIVRHVDGTSTVRTRVKGILFNISRLDSELLQRVTNVDLIELGSQYKPGLTPYFGRDKPSFFQLPLRAQPSPWHMIWRALDPTIDPALAAILRVDGFAMDTF